MKTKEIVLLQKQNEELKEEIRLMKYGETAAAKRSLSEIIALAKRNMDLHFENEELKKRLGSLKSAEK